MADVKCSNCGLLFGKEQRDDVLDIKHRDLFRTIRGGTVEGPCRRCGARVSWPQEQETETTRDR